MPDRSSQPPITMDDLARELGISRGAVSLALRNSPKISTTTKEKVHALAEKLGFRPNAMASGLAKKKVFSQIRPVSDAIAWLNLWPEPAKLRQLAEFDLYWKGALQTAENMGYRLEEFVANDPPSFRRIERILLARNVNGILITPHTGFTINWSCMNWDQFSVVRFGQAMPGMPPFQAVTSDQASNAALAFAKMTERGYQRIGFVGAETTVWKTLGGFCQAQFTTIPASRRIPPLLYRMWEEEKNFNRLAYWLKHSKPDAILTERAELPAQLATLGIKAPEQIGIASMSILDIETDAGIYQNSEEIGRVAIHNLISLMRDNLRGAPSIFRQALVAGKWVDGSSLPPKET